MATSFELQNDFYLKLTILDSTKIQMMNFENSLAIDFSYYQFAPQTTSPIAFCLQYSPQFRPFVQVTAALSRNSPIHCCPHLAHPVFSLFSCSFWSRSNYQKLQRPNQTSFPHQYYILRIWKPK